MTTGFRVQAYVASALTGLVGGEREWILSVGDTVADFLRGAGVSVHQPAKVTDPLDHSDLPPGEVHRLDYAAVLNSDLVVALADFPSWGGGKEVAWAERNGSHVLLLARSSSAVSRLLIGGTGRLTMRSLTDVSSARLATASVLEEWWPALEAHAAWRVDRGARLAPVLEILRASIDPALNHSLGPRRLLEVIASESNLADASLGELLLIIESLPQRAARGTLHHLLNPLGDG